MFSTSTDIKNELNLLIDTSTIKKILINKDLNGKTPYY